MAKKFVSPRRARQKTNRVWIFSLIVLLLCIALVLGAVLERRWGLQKMVEVLPLETPQTTQDQQYQEMLEKALGQLAKQATELKIKVDTLENIAEQLANTPPLNTNLNQGALIPPNINNTESFEEESDIIDKNSAESIGKALDRLKNKLSFQEDQLNGMDVLMRANVVDLSRAPTGYPASLTQVRKTSPFGYRVNPVTGAYRLHAGLDFAGPIGTPIYAASAGVVTKSGFQSGYGNTIEIDHGSNIMTRYAHASELIAKEGDLVAKKQMIARIGTTGNSTGPHVHYEVRLNNVPVDPILFLGKDLSQLAGQSKASVMEQIAQLAQASIDQDKRRK